MSLSIVQVATSFSGWGPDEWHVLELSERLQQTGHHVVVACRPCGWVEQQAGRMGLRSASFAISRQQDWREIGRMVRFFRRHNADVVHIHAHSDYVVPAVAAQIAGVPVRVMTGHHTKKLSSAHGARIYSDILYTHVIAASHAVREVLIESGMTAGRIEVIPYGIESECPRRPARPASQEDAVVVGIVGHIGADRGHSDLVEAARLLQGAYPLRYQIIGCGPDEDALRQRIASAGLGELFSFTRFRSDVDSIMAGLDIVVVPTASPQTCCAVIQKAMMLGKPVIGSRAGGNKELILDRQTGLLIPPRSASKLAAALARLAEDAQLRAEMGSAARARALTHYSLERMVARIDALYRSGLQNPRSVSPIKGILKTS